jgi:hypothetical protein
MIIGKGIKCTVHPCLTTGRAFGLPSSVLLNIDYRIIGKEGVNYLNVFFNPNISLFPKILTFAVRSGERGLGG